MLTKGVRDRIRGRMNRFLRKDPRKFPDLYIHFKSRTRPSGEVFLIRRGEKSEVIEDFNSLSELVMTIETICSRYKATEPKRKK